jgi:multiple sugar transport system permease protein
VWHVTVPSLRGILFIMLILQVIATAQVFLEPYLFTGGGPNNATVTILLFIYNKAFRNSLGGDFGEATALSVMLAIVLGILSWLYFKLTNRWSTS